MGVLRRLILFLRRFKEQREGKFFKSLISAISFSSKVNSLNLGQSQIPFKSFNLFIFIFKNSSLGCPPNSSALAISFSDTSNFLNSGSLSFSSLVNLLPDTFKNWRYLRADSSKAGLNCQSEVIQFFEQFKLSKKGSQVTKLISDIQFPDKSRQRKWRQLSKGLNNFSISFSAKFNLIYAYDPLFYILEIFDRFSLIS
ncbi:hypothetical protein TTHERM_000047159 (macronuclear) [Tetrahymena thermophila SB210]|uniref:Uncharacterized protein n=1 Tax=Tetrahymena thermophila (strain SB210) TaxID=312017 RepID=W7XBA4_TETTS|nr:hypothetical protein TTHERM_000047159 [Tetrahymena thermophila SB210]EWS74612.1 hypothetical protein TTHERM_000047159 [Tetrahymena thermophila SB210]|eukprot:XP_012652834.1 hypothetical protein TTHERM_000047159 [Tetrahymena thermophila SB210]